jgi:endonuclease/exonuclease/phosphatase family metal-dependent hydrolase
VRLRVATYNVQSFRAGVEPVRDVLASALPDLALLQECGSRRLLLDLAAHLELEVVSSHRLFHRARHAVLYRPVWHLTTTVVRRLSRGGRGAQRGFIAASLRRMGTRMTALSTRLGLSATQRELHSRELTDFLAGADGLVVAGADLNEGPDGTASRWIAERLFDAFATHGVRDGDTFPADVPTVRVDYLFVSDGVKVQRAWIPDGPDVARASDHRPVVADLELAEP